MGATGAEHTGIGRIRPGRSRAASWSGSSRCSQSVEQDRRPVPGRARTPLGVPVSPLRRVRAHRAPPGPPHVGTTDRASSCVLARVVQGKHQAEARGARRGASASAVATSTLQPNRVTRTRLTYVRLDGSESAAKSSDATIKITTLVRAIRKIRMYRARPLGASRQGPFGRCLVESPTPS